MQYDEIVDRFVNGKLIPMMDWINAQLDNDPQVADKSNREKVCLYKFMLDQREQFRDFLETPDMDERDNQDDEIFGDNDIAVGPGKATALDFLDPPEDDEYPEDDDFEHDDFFPEDEDDN